MTAADIGATLTNASRLGSSAGVLLEAVEHRAELAVLELEEAGSRLASTLMWGVVAGIALLLSGITLTAIVAAAFWDTDFRVMALVVLGVVELAVGAIAARLVLARCRQWNAFTHLRDQLTKDCACLREVLAPDPD